MCIAGCCVTQEEVDHEQWSGPFANNCDNPGGHSLVDEENTYVCLSYIYLFYSPNGNINLKHNDMNIEDCLYYTTYVTQPMAGNICVYTTKYGHTLVHRLYHTQQTYTHHMLIINNIGASASTVFVLACASAAPQRH